MYLEARIFLAYWLRKDGNSGWTDWRISQIKRLDSDS